MLSYGWCQPPHACRLRASGCGCFAQLKGETGKEAGTWLGSGSSLDSASQFSRTHNGPTSVSLQCTASQLALAGASPGSRCQRCCTTRVCFPKLLGGIASFTCELKRAPVDGQECMSHLIPSCGPHRVCYDPALQQQLLCVLSCLCPTPSEHSSPHL